MRNFTKVLSVILSALFVAGIAWAGAEFKTEQEKYSYAIGANIAKLLAQDGVSIDVTQLTQGLNDKLNGKSVLTEAETAAVLQALQSEVRQKKAAEQKKLALENQQRGTAYQAENAKKKGVKTLAGGLQYRVLKTGTGAIPTEDDNVLCNYRGMLVNGTVFDASPPGTPTSFGVSGVIPGWREALKLMPVGSKWELVIPAALSYGERGAAPAIGPNETLIFEVELVGIE